MRVPLGQGRHIQRGADCGGVDPWAVAAMTWDAWSAEGPRRVFNGRGFLLWRLFSAQKPGTA